MREVNAGVGISLSFYTCRYLLPPVVEERVSRSALFFVPIILQQTQTVTLPFTLRMGSAFSEIVHV